MGLVISNKIKILLVSLFLSHSISSCNKATPSYEQLMDSCFILRSSTEGKVDSYGTGFMYNNKVITNSHIITFVELGETYVHDNIYAIKGDEQFKLSVLEYSNEKDFALLKFNEEDKLSSLFSLDISFDYSISLGEEIFTIGNLNNYGLAVNFGHISSKEKYIEKKESSNYYIQTDIEISSGSSGGPIFNSNKKVIGIMTFKMRDNNGEYVDGASFYIPIDRAKDNITK